jgi:hypothetical protein
VQSEVNSEGECALVDDSILQENHASPVVNVTTQDFDHYGVKADRDCARQVFGGSGGTTTSNSTSSFSAQAGQNDAGINGVKGR